MSEPIEDLIVQPPDSARIAAIPSTNSYYAYPRLTCLAPIPETIRPTLETIWRKAIHRGRDVVAYRFTDVYVAEEGLAFDQSGKLLAPTRTYHDDEQIRRARAAVLAAIGSGSARTLERGILAKSRGADNYGHFLVEMLPRAWLARTRFGFPDWPAIIFDEPAPVRDVARAALQVAGFAPEEIVVTGREPVLVRDLVAIDGLTSHSTYLSPHVMQCFDTITAGIAPAPEADLYATRRPARIREFVEEPAIAERLRAMGYREVEAAALSFEDQVATFKGARSVVGCMGAAITNIVFCRPGTEVVVFTPSSAGETFFWMLAQARRLRYREIRCPEIGPQLWAMPWDRLIDVSPAELERLLTRSAPSEPPADRKPSRLHRGVSAFRAALARVWR
ncbi:capsular polysaccharide biosynthesis protein [Methylobacterium sp. BE186]|uniref:glycosyltransferase family 61 protein n=1 Tax=Methylobacterium sp. BE186 TaxID=2817715 RepID=UPI0028655492|nr:glycosyltransferase family 61 protein [Methylobacterium sp. BE186]MDR7038308.1 capsular polysaccharide biosynthesis protein [Methylobacterium sp. BE186]